MSTAAASAAQHSGLRGVEKRLDAERVASGQQLAPERVVEDEGVHAANVIQRLAAAPGQQLENALRIGVAVASATHAASTAAPSRLPRQAVSPHTLASASP
jgi:hypothetical protein